MLSDWKVACSNAEVCSEWQVERGLLFLTASHEGQLLATIEY
jgi:hypothetical protein